MKKSLFLNSMYVCVCMCIYLQPLWSSLAKITNFDIVDHDMRANVRHNECIYRKELVKDEKFSFDRYRNGSGQTTHGIIVSSLVDTLVASGTFVMPKRLRGWSQKSFEVLEGRHMKGKISCVHEGWLGRIVNG